VNWFKRIFTRRIEIVIQTGNVSSLDGWGQNQYTINLNPAECSDIKTVLAHELGHFMDNVADGMTKEVWSGYRDSKKNGRVSLAVLKCEASAWRNALKIYPKLDKKHLKYAFGTYQKSHKNPSWYLMQWCGNQMVGYVSNTYFTYDLPVKPRP
jgi:hypothetical protein